MRVLVYPHAMEIGGSQINAVQIAGAVRDRGHEVIVLSEPGPMVDRVRELGLEHLEIPFRRGEPSAWVRAELNRVVRDRRVDIVHGYEWAPVIEAYFGPKLHYSVPVIGTIMSMSVVWFFPRTIPLIVGTEEIRDDAIAAGHRRVTLLEPPVDTETDDPGLVNGMEFRAEHGIEDDETLVVIVSRLVSVLKFEGLRMACEAVGQLASTHRVRLVIVGGGPMYDQLAAHAKRANAAVGRRVVALAGEMIDPRPAYAAADVVVGMGGSALRGLAFGKPLVVVGEEGFSEMLTPSNVSTFLRQGWYGRGPGSMGSGTPALRDALQRLIAFPELRQELGKSSRQLVIERFSLDHAAKVQETEYIAAARANIPAITRSKDFVCTAAGLSARIMRRRYPTLTGAWLSPLLKTYRSRFLGPAGTALRQDF
ncbi:glycosyltransferase [Bradyrhizobium sp. CSA112]|uniref:glycosyltransferase family 4 protein n=1 Tax=Bradyrhizobium sp. CSA112 TaxID=2699170 RepID=UPI0023B128F9|nr:glycosyltransferase family 4 protein [Bradyrhizobium sp. CSA112]MDE5452796.1 glycosyltransferase [Bradyrhizobium sp. CSA112]